MGQTTPLDHNAAIRLLTAEHGTLSAREVSIAAGLLKALAQAAEAQAESRRPAGALGRIQSAPSLETIGVHQLRQLGHALDLTAGLALVMVDEPAPRGARCGSYARIDPENPQRIEQCIHLTGHDRAHSNGSFHWSDTADCVVGF